MECDEDEALAELPRIFAARRAALLAVERRQRRKEDARR